MKTYHNSPLLYEEGFSIIINEVATPIENSTFYYFDYDKRSHAINMDFPHFHSFYELMILLSPKAYHFVEGMCAPNIFGKNSQHFWQNILGKREPEIVLFKLPFLSLILRILL